MIKKKDREELEDLIRAFYYNESQKKEYASIADDKKAKIKALMKENDIKDFEVGDLKAKYVVSNTDEINEQALLELLKKHNITQCIRTVEVVDMDLLENALYHNEIPESVVKSMDKCKTTKEVVKLLVKKV